MYKYIIIIWCDSVLQLWAMELKLSNFYGKNCTIIYQKNLRDMIIS